MPDKKYPRCGLWSTDSALLCNCGYDFKNATVEKSDKDFGADISPSFISFATLTISIMLFVASLYFPVFNLSNGISVGGLSQLLTGWIYLICCVLFLPGGLNFTAWFANLFLVPAWIGLVLLRKFTYVGLVLTIIGIMFASTSLAVKEFLINESGSTVAVTSRGLGFYLWLSSFVVCLVGYLVVIARVKLILKKATTNQQ